MRTTIPILLCIVLVALPRASGALPVSPAVQRILNAQELRIADDPVMLDAIRYRTSQDTTRLAILAAGRIGSPMALELFSSILNKKDSSLKPLTAFAMSLLPEPAAPVILAQNLPMHRDPELKKWILRGIGRAGGEKQLTVLADSLAKETNIDLRAAAAESIGILWAGPSEKWAVPPGLLSKLTEYSRGPMPLSLTAAFALARYKGDPALLPADEIVKAVPLAKDTYAIAYLARVLSKLKHPKLAPLLTQLISAKQPLGVRVEAAKALGFFTPSNDIAEAVKTGLQDSHPSVLVSVLESVGNYRELGSPFVPAIHTIFQSHTSNWVRSTALQVLTRLKPQTYREWVLKILGATYAPITPAAILSLSHLEASTDRDLLATWIVSPFPGASNAALEAVQRLEEGKITGKIREAMLTVITSADAARVSYIAELVGRYKWKEFLEPMTALYPNMVDPDQIEAKMAVLKALGSVGDSKYLPFLKASLTDPNRPVVAAAVESIQKISGEDLTAKIPLNSKVTTTPPSIVEINSASPVTVAMRTSRGTFRLRTLPEAPLTSFRFVQLVRTGFYDGKTFHRVVPNFVVQGGDPRGDGFGGPGYFIRDEVSWRPHDRKAVGIATAGKDTGGSQFFVNLAPNPHLNGKYTLFGEIVSGMDVVDKLEIGDQIIAAKVEQ